MKKLADICFWQSESSTSPTEATEADIRRRLSSRQSMQVFADSFAFGQNLPMRMLDMDRLKELPQIVHGLLHEESMNVIYRSEWQSQFGSKSIVDVIPDWKQVDNISKDIDTCAQVMCTNLSANFANVCKNAKASINSDIAKNSYHEQLHTREFYDLIGKAIDDEIKDIADINFADYFGIENNRYNLLKKILPFLEREIWLSDNSCSTPFHSLTRTLDDWRLHVLLWFYHNRFELEGFVHRQQKKTDNDKSNRYTDNLFCMPHRLLYAYAPFSEKKHKNYLMLIGPITAEPDEPESQASLKMDRGIYICLTTTFSFFTKLLEKYDVYNDKRFIPKERELAEALTSRRLFTDKEIELYADSIRQSWNSLEQVEVDDTLVSGINSDELHAQSGIGQGSAADQWGREHIEHLACHILWGRRTIELIIRAISDIRNGNVITKKNISQFLSNLRAATADNNRHTKVIKEFWFDGNIDRVAESNYLIKQEFISNNDNYFGTWKLVSKNNAGDWQDKLENTKAILEVIKATSIYHSLDMPKALANRAYDRYMAHESRRLLYINNLIHRYYGLNFKHDGADSYYDPILIQVCGWICLHLAELARAHFAKLWLMDYKDGLESSLHCVGHFASIHQAHAAIKSIDDAIRSIKSKTASQSTQDVDKGEPISLLYRCVQRNRPVYLISVNKDNAVVEGYPKFHNIRSAIAIPMQINGRLLGVIECLGAEVKQFTPSTVRLLTRAAGFIAPFLYEQQLNHSMTKIIENVLDKGHTARYELMPFKDIVRHLGNIFLCKAAHLWLRKPDSGYEFELKGSLFQESVNGQNKINFSIAETLNKDKPDANDYLLARLPVQSGVDPSTKTSRLSIKAKNADDFRQASYNSKRPYSYDPLFADDNIEPTDYNNYCNHKAILGKDFLTNSNNKKVDALRINLYETCKISEAMVFALTRSYRAKAHPITELNKPHVISTPNSHQNKNEKEVVGFISLYNDNYFGYTAGWRQIIAIINEHLQLAVLHLQLLSNRYDQAQDFARHELSHQAQYVRNSLRKLKSQNDFIRSPALANSISRSLNDFGDSLTETQKNNEHYQQLQNLIADILRAAKASHDTHNSLVASTSLFDERISRLSKIEDLEDFRIPVNETWDIVELNALIAEFAKAYRSELAEKGVFIDISGMNSFRVRTYSSLINHIFTNIFENATSYCQANSAIDISMDFDHGIKKKAIVTISNWGPYDSHISAEDLLAYGRRGTYASDIYTNSSTNSGKGIGLWSVSKACDLARIKLKYLIDPSSGATESRQLLAKHSIILNFVDVVA